MDVLDRLDRVLSYATLRRTRAVLSGSGGRTMVLFFAVLYGLISLWQGQMLVLERNPGPHYAFLIWSGNGAQPWNYPAVLISEGWGVLVLPFFSTVSMVVVSVGVGLGMAAAVILVVQLLRDRRAVDGRGAVAGTLTGLSPALLALMTLGACCSTTAVATAGIGVLAQSTGGTPGALLSQGWILGVLQMVILWIALVAQEQLIRVYSVSVGGADLAAAAERPAVAPLWSSALRVALVAGGLALALSTVVDWATVSPMTASVATWVDWLALQIGVGSVAVVTGLFPKGALELLGGPGRRVPRIVARAALLGSGVLLAGWTPPMIASAGLYGFVNELLGAVGSPSSWGAVPAGATGGVGLEIRWVFVLLLPAFVAIALAAKPTWTVGALLGGASRPRGPSPIGSLGSPTGPRSAPGTASGEP